VTFFFLLIIITYRAQYFLEEALTLHNQFCKDFSKIAKDELESLETTSSSKGLNNDIKKVVMFSISSSSLIDSYRCFFDEMVDQLSNINISHNPDDISIQENRDNIRKGLASALYEVAYSEAVNIHNSFGVSSNVLKMLRVPWSIVIKELNEIKNDQKLLQSSLSSSISKEIEKMTI